MSAFFRTPFYLLKSDSERKPRLIDIPGNLIEWPLYKNTQCISRPSGNKVSVITASLKSYSQYLKS